MRIFTVIFTLLWANTAHADSFELANQLGGILASEEFCGLAYDHDAIAAFVEKKVPADDMSFTSTLNLMTTGNKHNQKSMSASSKAAHCAQIKRVVKAYKFTK